MIDFRVPFRFAFDSCVSTLTSITHRLNFIGTLFGGRVSHVQRLADVSIVEPGRTLSVGVAWRILSLAANAVKRLYIIPVSFGDFAPYLNFR